MPTLAADLHRLRPTTSPIIHEKARGVRLSAASSGSRVRPGGRALIGICVHSVQTVVFTGVLLVLVLR